MPFLATRLSPSAAPPSQSWSAHQHVSSRISEILTIAQVAGESGLGKTTFINTLFSTTIKNYADHRRRHQKQIDKTVEIEITKAELEEKFFKGPSFTTLSPHHQSHSDKPSSSPYRYRHSWLRRLRQQQRLMATHHRVPRRSTRVIHAPGATTPSW